MPLSAAATEYCVTCSGPAAMYACAIEGQPADAPPDPRYQVLCITELARSGGHESCAVPRSAPKPCPGVPKLVAAPAVAPPAPAAATPDDTSRTEAEKSTEEAPAKPPETVEELAKETVKSSKKGLEKAGEAVSETAKSAGKSIEGAGSTVGKAAKKTWDCITSLFSDC